MCVGNIHAHTSRCCACACPVQPLLRDLVKELDLGVTTVSLYEDWKAAMESKAGERLAKVEEGFL